MKKKILYGKLHMDGKFTHCGRDIEHETVRGKRKKIKMSQKTYALGVKRLHLSRERRAQLEADTTPLEKSALRAGGGKLGWLARNTRLDLAFDHAMLHRTTFMAQAHT